MFNRPARFSYFSRKRLLSAAGALCGDKRVVRRRALWTAGGQSHERRSSSVNAFLRLPWRVLPFRATLRRKPQGYFVTIRSKQQLTICRNVLLIKDQFY
jgi:hypothetical protein